MNKSAAARFISGVRSMCSVARPNNHSNSVKETKPRLQETVNPELAAMLQAAREEGIQQERARLFEVARSFPAKKQPQIPLEDRTTLGPYILIPAVAVSVTWIAEFLIAKPP